MNKRLEKGERPVFPKRAVVTGGMPLWKDRKSVV